MPKAANLEVNSNRFNPYITKTISKTLLTPCRQVGLSRKRKTPNSSDKISDIIKSSSQELEQISSNPTRVTSKITSLDSSSENIKVESTITKSNVKKKSVAKCLIADVKTDQSSLEVTALSNKSSSFNTDCEDKMIKPKEKKKKVEEASSNETASESEKTKGKKSENSSIKNKSKDGEYKIAEEKITKEKSRDNGSSKKSTLDFKESEKVKGKKSEERPSSTKIKSRDDKNKKTEEKMSIEEKSRDNESSKKSTSYFKESEKVQHKKMNEKLPSIKDRSRDNINKKSEEKLPLKETPVDNQLIELYSEIAKPIEQSISDEKLHSSKEKTSVASVVKENEIKIKSTTEDTSNLLLEKSKSTKEQEITQVLKLTEKCKTEPILDHTYKKPEKKNKKLKRSLSMKKPSEDDDTRKPPLTETIKGQPVKSPPLIEKPKVKECSVVLNEIDCNTTIQETPVHISEQDIKNLEKEVREKRKLVEDLTQAEIYKKLHNVDKLKALTTMWKTGCISALNDLLPHLQTHGDFDMALLLKNLKVPEKLIKLSDTGDLI